MTAVRRWAIIVPASIACALLAGVVAAHFGPADDTIEVLVFACCLWAPFVGLFYVVLAPRELIPEHPEDNVESAWLQRATSGAFLDLVAVLGLSLALSSLLQVGQVPTLALLLLAMSDAGLRYLVISRREA